jgi:spermidine synthase
VLKTLWTVELSFGPGTGQSRMLRWFPDRLLIDYTRTMLAALLHVPAPRDIGIVGLGGGSQLKFLHRHLPEARIEVFEIDPAVIALRREFRIPNDGPRLKVVEADAARALDERVAAYDLLLIDGYDAGGLPAALSTAGFYRRCRASLRPGGALALNLYDTDSALHLRHLAAAFAPEPLTVLDEPCHDNRVVFGFVPGGTPAPSALSRAGRRQLRAALARLAAVRPTG